MGFPKMVPKGNLLEMISNWQISIGYEDNQIMTPVPTTQVSMPVVTQMQVPGSVGARDGQSRMHSSHSSQVSVPEVMQMQVQGSVFAGKP